MYKFFIGCIICKYKFSFELFKNLWGIHHVSLSLGDVYLYYFLYIYFVLFMILIYLFAVKYIILELL